jgi:TP901 family phage tail tape measure protein
MPRGSSNGELVVDIVANASSIAQTAKEAIEAMAKSIAKNKNIGDSVKQTIAEPFAQVTANVEALSQEVQDLKSVIQHPVDKSGFEQYIKQLSDLQKTVGVVQKTVADLSQSYNNLASKGPIDESQTDAILARLNQANEIAEQAEKTASSMRQILIPAQKASAAEYLGFSPEEAMSQLKTFKAERDKLNDEDWNKRLNIPKGKNITDFSGYAKNYAEVLRQYQEAEDEYYSNADNNDIYDKWKDRIETRNGALIDLAYADFSTASDKEVLFNNIERANEQVNKFYQQNKAVIDQMTAAETKYVEMGQAVQDYYSLFNENGQFHLSRKVTKEVLGGGVESVLVDAREKVSTRANELNSYVRSMQSVLDFYGKEQKVIDADQALFNFKNGSIKIPLKISTTSKALTEEIKQVVDDVNKNIEESGLTVNIKTNVPELKIQAGQIVVDGTEIKQAPKSTSRKSQSKAPNTPPQPPILPAPSAPSETEPEPVPEEPPKSTKGSNSKKSSSSRSTKGKTSATKEPTPSSDEVLTNEAKDPDKEYIQDVIPRLRQEIADLKAKVKPREEFEASVRESLSTLQEGDRYTAEAFEALVKEQAERLYNEQPELTEIANRTDRLNNLEAIQARMDAAKKDKATNKKAKSSASYSKKGPNSKSKTSKGKSSSYVSPYADMSDAQLEQMMAEAKDNVDQIDESIANAKAIQEKYKEKEEQYQKALTDLKEEEQKISELTASDYNGNKKEIDSRKQNVDNLNKQLESLSNAHNEYKSASSALRTLNSQKKKGPKHDYNSIKHELDKRKKQREAETDVEPEVVTENIEQLETTESNLDLAVIKLQNAIEADYAQIAAIDKEAAGLKEAAEKLSSKTDAPAVEPTYEERLKLAQMGDKLSELYTELTKLDFPENVSKFSPEEKAAEEKRLKKAIASQKGKITKFENKIKKAKAGNKENEPLNEELSANLNRQAELNNERNDLLSHIEQLEAIKNAATASKVESKNVTSSDAKAKSKTTKQEKPSEANTPEIDLQSERAKIDNDIAQKKNALAKAKEAYTKAQKEYSDLNEQAKKLDEAKSKISEERQTLDQLFFRLQIVQGDHPEGGEKVDAASQKVDEQQSKVNELIKNLPSEEQQKEINRAASLAGERLRKAGNNQKKLQQEIDQLEADKKALSATSSQKISASSQKKTGSQSKSKASTSKASKVQTPKVEDAAKELKPQEQQANISALDIEIAEQTESLIQVQKEIASLEDRQKTSQERPEDVVKASAEYLEYLKQTTAFMHRIVKRYLPSEKGIGENILENDWDFSVFKKAEQEGDTTLSDILSLRSRYETAISPNHDYSQELQEAYARQSALQERLKELEQEKKEQLTKEQNQSRSSDKKGQVANQPSESSSKKPEVDTTKLTSASSNIDSLEVELAEQTAALSQAEEKVADLRRKRDDYRKQRNNVLKEAAKLSDPKNSNEDLAKAITPYLPSKEGVGEEIPDALKESLKSSEVGSQLLNTIQKLKDDYIVASKNYDEAQKSVDDACKEKRALDKKINKLEFAIDKAKGKSTKSASSKQTKTPDAKSSKDSNKSSKGSNEPSIKPIQEEIVTGFSEVQPEHIQQFFDAFKGNTQVDDAKKKLSEFVEVLKILKQLLEELQKVNGVEEFVDKFSQIGPVITKLNGLLQASSGIIKKENVSGLDKQFSDIGSSIKNLIPDGKFTTNQDEKNNLLSEIGTALQNYWQAGGTKQVKDFNDVLGFKLKGGQAKAIQKAADSATPSVEKPQTRFEKLTQQITELTNGPIDQLYEKLKTVQGLLSGDVWSSWSKDIKDLTKVFTDSVNQLDKMIKKLTQLMGLKDEVEEEEPRVEIKDFPAESGGGGGPKLPSTRVRKNRSGGGFNNFGDFTSDFWNRWDYYYGNAPQTFAKRHQSINTQSSALSAMQLFGAPVNENYSLDLSNFLPGVDEAVDNVKTEWQELTTVFQKNQDIFWKYVTGSRQIDDDDLAIVQSWIERTKALTKDVATLNKQYQSGSILRNASQGTIVESTFGKVEDVDQARKSIQELVSAFNATGTFTANGSKFVGTFTQANGEVQKLSLSWDKVNKAIRQTTELQSTANLSTLLSSSIKATTADLSRFVTMTFSTQRALSKVAESLREGWQAFKDYDAAMTSVKYTMDMTEEQFDSLGKSTIQMAKDLNLSIQDAMGITQIYANMQTTPEEILTVARPTAILSNLAGIDTSTAANEIQSVLQQFQMSEEEAAHVVDIYDKVSANIKIDYAAGIEDIAQGVQTAGQVAADAGVSFAELASLIGKVAERTREDGSSIGNALKTIIVRLSKASELSGADEVDTNTLSDASKALHDVGVEVYNLDGSFRPLMTILGELSAKWNDLSDAQQANISYAVAATRLT